MLHDKLLTSCQSAVSALNVEVQCMRVTCAQRKLGKTARCHPQERPPQTAYRMTRSEGAVHSADRWSAELRSGLALERDSVVKESGVRLVQAWRRLQRTALVDETRLAFNRRSLGIMAPRRGRCAPWFHPKGANRIRLSSSGCPGSAFRDAWQLCPEDPLELRDERVVRRRNLATFIFANNRCWHVAQSSQRLLRHTLCRSSAHDR